MKKICPVFFLIFSIGCSAVQVINDKFDNSTLIKLERDQRDFIQQAGNVEINTMILSREYKAGINKAPVKLFFKFEGRQGEVLEGNTIEIKTDDIIHKCKLIEKRSEVYEKAISSSSTSYTWIGAFTYTDSTRSNINVIAIESILSPEVIKAMDNAKSISFRILTKNIDGISKNTYTVVDFLVGDIKDFINYNLTN